MIAARGKIPEGKRPASVEAWRKKKESRKRGSRRFSPAFASDEGENKSSEEGWCGNVAFLCEHHPRNRGAKGRRVSCAGRRGEEKSRREAFCLCHVHQKGEASGLRGSGKSFCGSKWMLSFITKRKRPLLQFILPILLLSKGIGCLDVTEERGGGKKSV